MHRSQTNRCCSSCASASAARSDRRLIEAIGGDHTAQLAASRDLLGLIADGIDTGDDALVELLGSNPDLAVRALAEALLLRQTAVRLQDLQDQITEHLRTAHE
jgi:hypothetical protein